ncbi:ribokinase [Microbacterium sp. B2969]|uniref:Ribokinase n=1 Tax=Microbacterium alkaliflavum TaxID=3248839 RepID=A0ABW7QF04_9MICO
MTVDGAAPRTVFVFGSAHHDLMLSVGVLPSPGETVLAGAIAHGFGGKGANQAIAAARAGGHVTFVGLVGDDEWAERIVDNLAANGIDTTFVGHRSGEPTGLAVVIVDDDGGNQIVVASGAGRLFSDEAILPAIKRVRHGDIVVVQCEIPAPAVERIVRLATEAGASVVLNLAPYTALADDALAAAAVIIVNESEARALVGEGVALDRLAHDVVEAIGTACIVTLGGDGSIYAAPDTQAISVPARHVDNVIDTTGAGDVYVGTFAARLARDADVRTAMEDASSAAALSVLGRGAQSRQPESAGDLIG